MIQNTIKRLSIILFLNLGAFSLASAATHNFITLADIHFDPYISCHSKPCPLIQKLRETPADHWSQVLKQDDTSKTQYGKDTNYPLLASALTAAKVQAQNNHAEFVMVIGDFLGHGYDKKYRKFSGDNSKAGYVNFVKKTMTFYRDELKQAFPNINVYWVIGNNDSYQTDYYTVPDGSFFKDMSELQAGLLQDKKSREDLPGQFSRGGYYSLAAPQQPHLRLVFLNSVLFSRKAKGPGIEQAATAQLDWLHQQLMEAERKNQRLLIAMHIPTGIDVYTSFFIPFSFIEFWKKDYTQRFLAEMSQNSGQVMAVFTAHIHADAFQIYSENNQKSIPFTGTPSISPIFGNNPAFKVYSYSEPDLRLSDFTTYYQALGNDQWGKEYNFDEAYQLKQQDADMLAGMNKLQPTGELAEHYKVYYAVNSNSQPITKWNKWYPYYWCAVHGITGTAYQSCLSKKGSSLSKPNLLFHFTPHIPS